MPFVLPPSSPCSFCDYLAGHTPYTILDRNDTSALLVTYEQRGRGHLLAIPIKHRETILDLDLHEQATLMSDVVRATAAIVGAFDPAGVAVWQNNGTPAHQSVPHPFPRRRNPARWRHRTGRSNQAHDCRDRRTRRTTPATPPTPRPQQELTVSPSSGAEPLSVEELLVTVGW